MDRDTIIGYILIIGVPLITIILFITKHYFLFSIGLIASTILILMTAIPEIVLDEIQKANDFYLDWKTKKMIKQMTKEFNKK